MPELCICGGVGSLKDLFEIPKDIRELFVSANDIDQNLISDHAHYRQAFIDQAQSKNKYIPNPTVSELSETIIHSWRRREKTLVYYTHTRGETGIKSSLETIRNKYQDKYILYELNGYEYLYPDDPRNQQSVNNQEYQSEEHQIRGSTEKSEVSEVNGQMDEMDDSGMSCALGGGGCGA